ncbi:hypothetical protein SISSUDRAFT_880486 [Sistotremastrum suecicum HHB10207 ss-3]|uniref:Shugoshin C-terminal domain-containing protein n=1 Tax=Sistotremastrum suecicum HHB10207 ss-3 TaxID=1314776 RepID=A0A166CA05_9AGAM|nr:hypothetical protein SISSUDRAFT_880486 [Sistotremastrum suecicum HHB10207 ss-3]
MSRRNSRSNPTEFDALLEFETFKKKYLIVNRHITKLNSTLSVRVEELNAQIGELYGENLRLKAENVALTVQLKREKGKMRNLMAEAELATEQLMRQISSLRHSFSISHHSPFPDEPQRSRATRPSTNPPPRISRPPAFEQIHEVLAEEGDNEAEDDDEEPTPTRPPSRRLGDSRLPRLVIEPSNGESSAVSIDKKKAMRRQSGLLEHIPRPASPLAMSPTTPVPVAELGPLREDEEAEVLALVDPKPKVMKPKDIPKIVPPEKVERVVPERLKDVTNSSGNPRSSTLQLPPTPSTVSSSPISLFSPASSAATCTPLTTPSTTPKPSPIYLNTPVSADPPSRYTPVDEAPSEDKTNTITASGSRERRARKSVNYAEPKLNTKMRKPSPPPSPLPTVGSSVKRKKPPLFHGTTSADDDAGAEGDAEVDGDTDGSISKPIRTHGRRRSGGGSLGVVPIGVGAGGLKIDTGADTLDGAGRRHSTAS